MAFRTLTVILLMTSVALAGCSSDNSDDDLDGLFADEERNGWNVIVDLYGRRVEYRVDSDPEVADTDGDGVVDRDEFLNALDPRKADTDEDGLTDCQELYHQNQTECADPSFTGPFRPLRTDPKNADSDASGGRYWINAGTFVDETGDLARQGGVRWGDGISDGDEITGYTIDLANGGTRTITTDPLDADSDNDALHDGEERLVYGSDPTVKDSDGDGCIDGLDAFPDRAETYLLGLQDFTLKQDMDALGGADLVLQVRFLDEERFLPASGSLQVEKGTPRGLSNYWTDGMTIERCSVPGNTYLTTMDPWVPLAIWARDDDGTSTEVLDIYSETGTVVATSFHAFWHVRDDVFNWEPSLEGAFDGPLVFEGADGRLRLAPTVAS